MSKSEIAARRREIDKERQRAVSVAVDAHNSIYRAEIESLKSACGDIGHSWKFTHFGPTHLPWYICTCCGASKVMED